MIAENSKRVFSQWKFPRLPCEELLNGIAMEWSWINGKEVDLDDDLLASLDGNSLKIIKALASGGLIVRKDLESKIWGDTPGTDDRLRKAIDRINERLVGGDLDRFRLEVELADHARLVRRK